MSGALRRLREHFENELLVRVGRQMELTPLARSLALPVREALLKAETALNTQPSFDALTAERHSACRHVRLYLTRLTPQTHADPGCRGTELYRTDRGL